MLKIAYYLKHLSRDQRTLSLPQKSTVFIDDQTRFLHNGTVLPSSELFGYDGNIVATCLDTACTILQSVTICKKMLYMWDLDWVRPNFKDYTWNQNILQNPELIIVTRSEDYARAIEKYCYRKAFVSAFNEEELKKVFAEEKVMK